ncbi:MAG: bifunctional hydroxymethylpyrimidine kinase/phosphomethylpyrimidine kinase [Hyphomicrobiales bacterium]|nr:bifunctional hydroxymethylpyrimidine kinase/phosphomethylpyrimidine kinase [Hyphomicrobiales bacterium]
MKGRVANALSIAGSDPSGGAGVQADLKTFGALGCYGMAAITALTAQNTRGVTAIHTPPPEFVLAEVDAVFADVRVDAVKVGMLGNAAIATGLAARLARRSGIPIVLDPVLVATSGDALAEEGVVEAILAELMPLATIITPNIDETARLTGDAPPRTIDEMCRAGVTLLAKGAKAALVKGGHLSGETSADVLLANDAVHIFESPRIATRNTHGTGCTLSSAIAAFLAQGFSLEEAVRRAKDYVTEALRGSDRLDVGAGHGPLNHFARYL